MGAQEGSSDEEYSEDEELALERAALGLSTTKKDGREHIYNVDGIHERLEDIGRMASGSWKDTLLCTSTEVEEPANAEDDLERELYFYNQALDAVKSSVQKFEKAKIKWRRPADYFAEMVKSDDHMKRVKEKLLYEKKLAEEQEQRRKQRESKKYAKQVQAEKLKERAKAKNQQIDALKEWRKQRESSNYDSAGMENFPMDLDFGKALNNQNKGKQPTGTRIFAGQAKSKQRMARDKKFGHGGRKKLSKQNDAASSGDMSSYKQGTFGRKRGVKKASNKKQRPGKSKRAAMRQKRQ